MRSEALNAFLKTLEAWAEQATDAELTAAYVTIVSTAYPRFLASPKSSIRENFLFGTAQRGITTREEAVAALIRIELVAQLFHRQLV